MHFDYDSVKGKLHYIPKQYHFEGLALYQSTIVIYLHVSLIETLKSSELLTSKAECAYRDNQASNIPSQQFISKH